MKSKLYHKIYVCAFALFALLSLDLWGQSKELLYISPNNDGVQDVLEVPMILKEKGYIVEWSFIIEDESGKVVRTISNKEKRDGSITMKNLFKQLITPKASVAVPATVVWNGITESGEVAQDGLYYYHVTAMDNNGNRRITQKLGVIVDNTPPEVKIEELKDTQRIFGEGDKAILELQQTGSKEDLWNAVFTDTKGNPVRSFTFTTSSPENVTWDGLDDKGNIVPDGVYSYNISAKDKAGNSTKEIVSNIIFSAEKPAVNIAIVGARYFSPGTKSSMSTLTLEPTIPEPKSSNKLTSWTVAITDAKGSTVRTYKGGTSAPNLIAFDGKSDNGAKLPDGEYKAQAVATYLNGYKTQPIFSPTFVLDTVSPEVKLDALSYTIFSNAKDSAKPNMPIKQTTSSEDEWHAVIRDAKTKDVVHTYDWGGKAASTVEWDGTNDFGSPCPDGDYIYEISATDLAGNYGIAQTIPFKLDTTPTQLQLDASPIAFSPATENNHADFKSKILSTAGIQDWEFSVQDKSGNTVYSKSDKSELPANFIWDGSSSKGGKTCPDGTYNAVIKANAINGMSGIVQSGSVVLDTTPPQIKLGKLPYTTFSPSTDSSLSTMPITQETSTEPQWNATIKNIDTGKVVRNYSWASQPEAKLSWDGIDDDGKLCADGKYVYELSATDLAGNFAKAQTSNFTLDTSKTELLLSASCTAFSPVGQKAKSVDFSPLAKATSGITDWQFNIQDTSGKVVYTQEGSGNLPPKWTWNGKDSSAKICPDGVYVGVLEAVAVNGTKSRVSSQNVTLDATIPMVTLNAAYTMFSPNMDGERDTIPFTATSSNEPHWTGYIKDANDAIVKTYNWDGVVPNFNWDGTTDSGAKAPDGVYSLTVESMDIAGNYGVSTLKNLSMDTSMPEVQLAANRAIFSPISKNPTIDFVPALKGANGITNWEFNILDAKGVKVFSQSNTGNLPQKWTWNGTNTQKALCPDGVYIADLQVTATNGVKGKAISQKVTLDATNPSVKITCDYMLFSPDKDGNKDVVTFTASSSKEARWNASIKNAKGALVKTFTWQDSIVPKFSWDGTDNSGNKAPDGVYSLTVESTDIAGNYGVANIANITADTRPARAWLTTSLPAFSPNADGFKDTQNINTRISLKDGIESWKLAITKADGTILKEWSDITGKTLPQESIIWDGLDNKGKITEGVLTARLTMSYAKGNKVDIATSPFILSITPPKLSVLTNPEFFSPDNDGENDDLSIKLKGEDIVPLSNWSFTINDPQNGNKFYGLGGKATISDNILWDGRGTNGELVQSAMDYPYTFTATDSLGMSSTVSGKISIDVLLVRDGNVLKMQVPAIIFRSNSADFKSVEEVAKGPVADRVNKGLEQSVIDNNNRVLKRIAEILKKFKNYSVIVEGHANNVSGTEAEETSTAGGNIPLVPLSKARAEFVISELKRYGIDSSRLKAEGLGGRKPIVKREDRDNWWKNRRVEFILKK